MARAVVPVPRKRERRPTPSPHLAADDPPAPGGPTARAVVRGRRAGHVHPRARPHHQQIGSVRETDGDLRSLLLLLQSGVAGGSPATPRRAEGEGGAGGE